MEDSEEIVLRFAGDLLLVNHYESAVGLDVSRGFREFDLLSTADIGMVNLESPVTLRGTRMEKPFTFRMHPRFLPALNDAGIDIVNLANNHIYDFDSTGLFDTIFYLDSVGMQYVGAGRNFDDAHRPVLAEIKGKRIAFFGYYKGGEAPAAGETEPGVASRELELIQDDIRMARNRDSVDYVIVNLHWGNEKETIPKVEHVEFARQLIDMGVDVIVGHHPHVLQGVEYYQGGIIAYSLGNFIFGGNSRHTYDTAILEISIKNNLLSYGLLPVRIDNWRARNLTGNDGAALVRMVNDLPILLPETSEER